MQHEHRKNKEKSNLKTIYYFIPKKVEKLNGKCQIILKKVCQKAFTTILGVSKDRLQRICKNHLTTMELPIERRGGDRKSQQYSDRFKSVKAYIKGIKAIESHYVRGRSTVQYLSSHLNIKKLHAIYNNCTENVPVKYEFFRRIFKKNFNLSLKRRLQMPAQSASS